MKRGILLLGLPIVSGMLAVISFSLRPKSPTSRPVRPSTVSVKLHESDSAPIPSSPATERLSVDRRTALGDFVAEFERGGTPVLPAGDLTEDDIEFLAQEMGRQP